MKDEKTGWRDLNMSLQHRKYGQYCLATDLDMILCEYDYGNPVAIFEYKNENCGKVKLSDSNIQCLINLGNMASLPVFCVKYKRDFSKFFIVALNEIAKKKLKRDRLIVSERRYISFLYYLRGKKIPSELKFDKNERLITKEN